MPSTAEWLSANPDILGQMQKGSDYVNNLYSRAANVQAGQQYGAGDTQGAATTLANSGDIANAAKLHDMAVQQAAQHQQIISRYVGTLSQLYDQAVQQGGPELGAQRLKDAFPYIAHDAAQLGIDPNTLAQIHQGLQTDPAGTLNLFKSLAQRDIQFQKIDDTTTAMFDKNSQQIVGTIKGSKFITQGPGQAVLQVGGEQSSSGAAPSQQTPQAGGGTDPTGYQVGMTQGGGVFGGQMADPNAVAQVESGGNPLAVNPASGATGLMQTMPATLRDPGFGVSPAQDNSPQEQARVGQDYLGAMGNRYGNPVYQLVAEDWGPGNTDKWVKGGAHWQQLPRETRDYIGQVALAQVTGRPIPQRATQATPQPQQGNPNVRVVSPARPEFTPMEKTTPDQQREFPGAVGIKGSGEPMYPPSNTLASNVPDSAIDFSAQTYLRTGKLPTGTRNPILAMRIVSRAADLAKQAGMSVSDVVGAQQYRQSLSGALNQAAKIKTALQSYLGTFDRNLTSLRQVIPEGAAKSVPIINRWIQSGRISLKGDPDVTRLNVWIAAVRDEYAKILSGSTGSVTAITDAARTEADSLISNAQTAQQLYSALNAMEEESRNRLAATNETISGVNSELRASQPPKGAAASQKSQSSGQRIRVYNPATGKLE